MAFPIPDDLAKIFDQAETLHHAYFVGGCVRDWLMGQEVNDFDIEVFGVNYDVLANDLRRFGRIDLVGRSFGVIKLNTGQGIHDFSIARRDSKIGPGHRGFRIDIDEDISLEQASARRDFTVNALMYDPREKLVLDFHHGERDVAQRTLRHTSPAFSEDPLRVLRGMQLASRFDLQVASETIELSRRMKSGFKDLAVERVREEWFKWAKQSIRPSRGLLFLQDCGWLDHFPAIQALVNTPQDPEWHPEGDVFTHTCHCCDALAAMSDWHECEANSRVTYMLATLAHDFGKPSTTQDLVRDGRRRIVSPGHEEAGVPIARSFLESIMCPQSILDRVLPLVRNHLFHIHGVMTDRAVRRLARRLHPETIRGLCLVMAADHQGRPPLPAEIPSSVVELREMAQALSIQNEAPKPVLMGRHLIDLGLKPSPLFKDVLNASFEAQLDGVFEDLPGAYRWLLEQNQFSLESKAKETLISKCSLEEPPRIPQS